jgi:uncharacterized LabA/DUF88 family protein
MASSNDNVSMALFCDFENVALGVRDANYEKFDIKPVLERLLLKGSIVVKKSYCDWDRYKGFKSAMHEANFELIEIPHVRQSGKNSADIRMVVDALDLCYTKSHVNTFVIISGDSDFSPLVSKLRENAKKVIGVGVKQSTSDLLVANCDEFIFYDDLVRERRRADAAKRDTREGQGAKRTPEEEKRRREEMDKRRTQAVEMAVETFDALVAERGDSGKIWASVLKEAIKRRKPDFSESYYGFRTFGNLLEEARARGFLEFGRDEKSGAYVYRSSGVPVLGADGAAAVPAEGEAPVAPAAQGDAAEGGQGRHEGGRRGRNRGRDRRPFPNAGRLNEDVASDLQLAQDENVYAQVEAEHAADDAQFVPHPEDAGLEQDGVVADNAVIEHTVAVVDAVEAESAAQAAQAAAHAAESAKRKPPKLPARAAKAAKMKAQQAAAAAQPAPSGEPVTAQAAEPESVSEVTAAVVAEVGAETAIEDAVEAAQAAEADGAKPAANAGKGRGRAPAKGRGGKGTARAAKPEANGQAAAPAAQPAPAEATPQPEAAVAAPAESADASANAAQPARKPSTRGPRRPRKPDAKQGG